MLGMQGPHTGMTGNKLYSSDRHLQINALRRKVKRLKLGFIRTWVIICAVGLGSIQSRVFVMVRSFHVHVYQGNHIWSVSAGTRFTSAHKQHSVYWRGLSREWFRSCLAVKVGRGPNNFYCNGLLAKNGSKRRSCQQIYSATFRNFRSIRNDVTFHNHHWICR